MAVRRAISTDVTASLLLGSLWSNLVNYAVATFFDCGSTVMSEMLMMFLLSLALARPSFMKAGPVPNVDVSVIFR